MEPPFAFSWQHRRSYWDADWMQIAPACRPGWVILPSNVFTILYLWVSDQYTCTMYMYVRCSDSPESEMTVQYNNVSTWNMCACSEKHLVRHSYWLKHIFVVWYSRWLSHPKIESVLQFNKLWMKLVMYIHVFQLLWKWNLWSNL